MKNKGINIANLKDEASNLSLTFKNDKDKIKSFLDSKKTKFF